MVSPGEVCCGTFWLVPAGEARQGRYGELRLVRVRMLWQGAVRLGKDIIKERIERT